MLARRTFMLSITTVAVAPLLVSCGGSETQKARAFADFLQRRILDRPGVHIPILSDNDRASIGRFEADFLIIKRFNDELDASVKDYGRLLRPPPQNLPAADLPKYRADLSLARDMFTRVAATLDGASMRAGTAREKVDQPEAVKAKFDSAFEQLVLRPERAWRDLMPSAVATLDAEISIADFIAAHQADINSVGAQLQTSKPNVRKELDRLMGAYAANAAKMNEARRKLDLVVRGY